MIGTALHFADSQGEKTMRENDELSFSFFLSLSLSLSLSFSLSVFLSSLASSHPSEASDPAHAYLTFNGRRKFSASRLLFSGISARLTLR